MNTGRILLACLIADIFLISGPILCWKQNDKPWLWLGSTIIGEVIAWSTFGYALLTVLQGS